VIARSADVALAVWGPASDGAHGIHDVETQSPRLKRIHRVFTECVAVAPIRKPVRNLRDTRSRYRPFFWDRKGRLAAAGQRLGCLFGQGRSRGTGGQAGEHGVCVAVAEAFQHLQGTARAQVDCCVVQPVRESR
jgi:hypothetical protein